MSSISSDDRRGAVAEKSAAAKVVSPAGPLDVSDRTGDRRWGVVAILAAAAPALIAAAAMVVQRPSIYFDGDPAKDELALINAGHLAQLVGSNGRFGWSHPGPAWYYALEPFYLSLGGHSWSFVAANLLINGIALGLIVAVVWRARGSLLALFTAGVLVGYVALLGEQMFRYTWPPYAVVLPMFLLMVVAAAGAAGSTPAVAAALVVGSYAVQVHVGTVPTVAAVLAIMLALRFAPVLFPRWATSIPAARVSRGRWDRHLVWGGLLLFVLMWIPPAIDELTGHPGNLTLLWTFFTQNYPKHPYVQALSVLGRLVTPLEWPRVGSFQTPDISRVSPIFIAVAVAFEVCSLALVVVATRLRDRFAQSIGAVVAVSGLVVTLSIRDIDGSVYAYLLLWVTCLPLVLGVGWIALIPRLQPRPLGHVSARAPRGWVLLLTAAVIAMSILDVVAFLTLPPVPTAAPDTQTAWALTSVALASEPKGPVLVDMYTPDTWVVAAGLGLQLQKDGRPMRVRDDWVFLFGHQARMTGAEKIVLAVVDLPDSTTYASQHPGADLIGSTDAHSIFLTRGS